MKVFKPTLLILFSISLSFSGKSQLLKTYDIVSQSKITHEKPRVIYFTGLWCKPCMSKLKPLMDTFTKQKDIEFFVVFDRYGMTEKMINKLSESYDTSYFGLLPEKYYPAEKSRGLITLKVNAPRKTINTFVSDYNDAHNTTFTTDDIWVGVALVQKGNSIYITKESELDKLILEINSILKASN